MSESKSYSVQVRLEWCGYDTSRYVVTYADTVLPITVTSDNFSAMARYLRIRRSPYRISVKGDTSIQVNSILFDSLASRYKFEGVEDVTSLAEEIRFEVVERKGKAFVPRLKDVDFRFTEQFGLSGAPELSPDTVWLYGDPAVLERIDEVATAPFVVRNVSDSGYYTVPLNHLWRKYGNVRSSCDSIRVFLPVERFVERTFEVPVQFRTHEGVEKARLYPDRVEVTLWVLYDQYDQVGAEQVEAVVDYEGNINASELAVKVVSFPTTARVKSVEPSKLQYVIIR